MTADHVQTKREIQAMLAGGGARPRRRLGQHFLIDGNLMRRLVEASELAGGDVVLEVGAGTGGLTDLLLQRADHVVCVEIDPALYQILQERFRHAAGSGRLTLLHTDVLETKHRLARELDGVLATVGAGSGGMRLVSNLPYSIATPVVMNLLVSYPQFRRFVFTVQAEVGERFTAEPGCKAYGPLSIVSQIVCRCRVIARVPAEAFWPQPEVDSVMLRLDVRDDLPEGLRAPESVRRFALFLRRVFEHRRKTLRQAASYALGDRRRESSYGGIDASRRPETLTLDEWLELFHALEPADTGSGDGARR